ncbi:hypothetical protein SPMU_20690 [Sphingomonas mucosissima]|uniref:Lipoprotein n=1 Tax=Sphingomonas mucosissima TaxID=370959 RepID=A0A245ZIS5_9SPHN|nr:hypothetical protein SPMU_20690 [Sphingomonas mucosissima]
MMRRLAGCILLTLLITSCGDTDAELAGVCERRARVEIHLPGAWRAYLAQVTAERRAAGGDPGQRAFWPTADFRLRSQWAEGNTPEPQIGRIFDNDYLVRQRATGTLVATVRNVSLHSPGFGAVRSLSCLYNHTALYAEAWRNPSKD